MFSIRKKSVVLAALSGTTSFAVIGCASSSCPCFKQKAPVVSQTFAPVADQPVSDEATDLRGFHKSYALYESGATQGWPTRWYYVPNPDYSTPVNIGIEPFIFFGQAASLPVTLAVEPPFRQSVNYAGDVLPPSYTAMPPLPPEQGVSRRLPDPDPLAKPKSPVAPPLPPIIEKLPPTYVPPPASKPAKAASTPTTMPAR